MKIPEIDRRSFLDAVVLYQRLPPGARRFFVEKVQPSQGVPNAVMGEGREALLDSRLMVAGVRGKNASVDPRLLGFRRARRSLDRSRVFDSLSREFFHFRFRAFVERRDCGVCRPRHVQSLYTRVCASSWLKRFLAAKDAYWEKERQIEFRRGVTVTVRLPDAAEGFRALCEPERLLTALTGRALRRSAKRRAWPC